MQQRNPETELPDELIFGLEPGRVSSHIDHEAEIIELLAAARQLRPQGSLRPATVEMPFGLMIV